MSDALVDQDWIKPVCITVMPYTTFASVKYSASLGVGELLASTGMPRELNSMQAVFAMALAVAPPATPVLQVGACAITVWGLGLPAPALPNPKLTPRESG